MSKDIGDYSVPVDKAAGLLSVPLLDDEELVEGRRRRRGSHPLVKRPQVGCEVMDHSSMTMNDISKQQSSSARGQPHQPQILSTEKSLSIETSRPIERRSKAAKKVKPRIRVERSRTPLKKLMVQGVSINIFINQDDLSKVDVGALVSQISS